MKTAFAVIGIIAAAAGSAQAGVVVSQTDTHDDGSGNIRSSNSTIMTQGNRQKTVSEHSITITDLDKGVMVMLMPGTKTMIETPLAGMGAMAAAMGTASQNYKATGKSRSVAGHACEEFAGTVTILGMAGEVTAKSLSCISKGAPGAAEYGAFGRRMNEVMKMKQPAGGSLPEGVMLFSETTTPPPDLAAAIKKMGIPAEHAQQMMASMAKPGAQVSRTQVTAIKEQSLPVDTFAIPAGYTKQK